MGVSLLVAFVALVVFWTTAGEGASVAAPSPVGSLPPGVQERDRPIAQGAAREPIEEAVEEPEAPLDPSIEDTRRTADTSVRVLLEVKVLSETGRPLKGVEVGTHTRTFRLDDSPAATRGETDDSGTVELHVLPGGVQVHAVDDGDPVSMASGEVACIGPGPFSIELVLVPAAKVRGRVFDETSGLGIPNARVVGPGATRYGSVTDEKGEFELRAWPVDVMTGLQVRADGFGMEQVKLAVTSGGYWEIPARFGWEKQAGSGGVPWVEVGLVPEKTIVGTVVDSAGSAVPGARIEATGRFLTKARMAHLDVSKTTTDLDGAFQLSGLRSDITHSVGVEATDHLRAALLSPPNVYTDLGEIVLEPAYLVLGMVVDSTGRAVPGLRVECVSIEEKIPHQAWDPEEGSRRNRDGYSGHFPSTVTGYTSEDGSFRIPGPRTPELELRLGVVRRPFLERPLSRPASGDLDCGQIIVEEGLSIIDGRVRIPSGVEAPRASAVLASPVGDVFSRVPCSPSGEFRSWWPSRQLRADVLVVDPDGDEVLVETRGVTLETLLSAR